MNITDNKYADVLFNLYEAEYLPREEHKKNIFGKYKLTEEQKKARIDAKHLVDEVRTTPLTYNNLTYFADLIRILEKVFFYKNDLEFNNVVCLTKWDAHRKVIDIIPENHKDIAIKLQMEYDYDKTKYLLTLKIERSFGLKIINTYKIYDNNLDYADPSDLMVINTINRIICDEFSNILETYFNNIINHTVI